jgi:hypothetical protein
VLLCLKSVCAHSCGVLVFRLQSGYSPLPEDMALFKLDRKIRLWLKWGVVPAPEGGDGLASEAGAEAAPGAVVAAAPSAVASPTKPAALASPAAAASPARVVVPALPPDELLSTTAPKRGLLDVRIVPAQAPGMCCATGCLHAHSTPPPHPLPEALYTPYNHRHHITTPTNPATASTSTLYDTFPFPPPPPTPHPHPHPHPHPPPKLFCCCVRRPSPSCACAGSPCGHHGAQCDHHAPRLVAAAVHAHPLPTGAHGHAEAPGGLRRHQAQVVPAGAQRWSGRPRGRCGRGANQPRLPRGVRWRRAVPGQQLSCACARPLPQVVFCCCCFFPSAPIPAVASHPSPPTPPTPLCTLAHARTHTLLPAPLPAPSLGWGRVPCCTACPACCRAPGCTLPLAYCHGVRPSPLTPPSVRPPLCALLRPCTALPTSLPPSPPPPVPPSPRPPSPVPPPPPPPLQRRLLHAGPTKAGLAEGRRLIQDAVGASVKGASPFSPSQSFNKYGGQDILQEVLSLREDALLRQQGAGGGDGGGDDDDFDSEASEGVVGPAPPALIYARQHPRACLCDGARLC